MKLYLLIDRDESDINASNTIFGVFSTREKAEKVRNELLGNFQDFGDAEDHELVIDEFVLDEATDEYHWYMNNGN